MGIALRHEEHRCGYISEQIQAMVTIHDDSDSINNPEIAFKNILEKCTLAKNIKNVHDDLCNTGKNAFFLLQTNRCFNFNCRPCKYKD